MHLWPTRFALICLVLIHLPCNPVDAGERLSMLDNQLLFDFESSREVPSAQCALGLPASTRGDSLVYCRTLIKGGRPLNLYGKRFGKLSVVGRDGKTKWGNYKWMCICDCGKTTTVSSGNLVSGKTLSCGCFAKEQASKYNRIDLTGKTFGRLFVVSQASTDNNRVIMWNCRCTCGTNKIIRGTDLRSGAIVSCGCYHLERLREDHLNNNLTSEDRERRRQWADGTCKMRRISWDVAKRDKYKCVVCGSCEGKTVHHIFPWALHPELRYDKSNLVTMCKECHLQFHYIYGKSCDLDDLDEFICDDDN